MIARSATALLVCALVLSHAGAASADSGLALNDVPAIHAILGYGGGPPTPRATAPPSPSSSTAPDDTANPLGSGAGIVVLVVIGGAFLWLRSRTLRR